MLQHPARFQRVVLGAIVANTAVLIASLIDREHEALWEPVHVAFLVFFMLELGVRLAASNWHPITFIRASKWNTFDTTVILLSLLPVLGVDVSLLRVARLARVVHSLRHVGHLRLVDLARRPRREAITANI